MTATTLSARQHINQGTWKKSSSCLFNPKEPGKQRPKAFAKKTNCTRQVLALGPHLAYRTFFLARKRSGQSVYQAKGRWRFENQQLLNCCFPRQPRELEEIHRGQSNDFPLFTQRRCSLFYLFTVNRQTACGGSISEPTYPAARTEFAMSGRPIVLANWNKEDV